MIAVLVSRIILESKTLFCVPRSPLTPFYTLPQEKWTENGPFA